MGAIEHLTISLPADMVARLRDRVKAGDFADESAVIEDELARAEAARAVELLLPEINDADVEHWLQTEVAAACVEMDQNPADGIPIDEVVAYLKAERLARGE